MLTTFMRKVYKKINDLNDIGIVLLTGGGVAKVSGFYHIQVERLFKHWNEGLGIRICMAGSILPEGVLEFINLWPLKQWVLSVLLLCCIYTVFLQGLAKLPIKDNFFSVFTPKVCFILFVVDFAGNILVDIVVLQLGWPLLLVSGVKSCPISISPIILLFELLGLYIWRKLKKPKSSNG